MATTTGKRIKKKPSFEGNTVATASVGDYESIASCGASPTMGSRTNSARSIVNTQRFTNIESGISPFSSTKGSGKYRDDVSVRDAIVLCQKAYWNVPVFRSTVDLLTEMSMSPIYFSGGNVESRKFFTNWANKINSWSLTEMFFREYYRSGNIFLYKMFGVFDKSQMDKLGLIDVSAAIKKIPLRYLVLNPADIDVLGASSFTSPQYVKLINDFELGALLNPQTEEDKNIANSIPELKNINNKKGNKSFTISLDKGKLLTVFYKKQDYEPLAVPMGFPVLSDINWKLELKKIDMAISRSVQQAVLLITQGSEEIGPPTKENQDALRKIFEGGSVGKVLIADFTTKAEFIIPQIGDILDPKKYEIVDRDIRFGLNNILFGEDKFANSTTKMDAFLKRIELARVDFMDNFFKPQVKEIAKLMGFKSIPTPKWKNLNLKDNSAVLSRVYTRLLELGAISPEDAITAITENRLPDADELKESQTKLKQDLKDGFYVPLLNNGKEAPGEAGRPGGKGGSPQKSQKITPIGKKAAASFGFGIQAIASNLNKVAEFEKRALLFAKSQYKVKKLTEGQQSLITELVDIIISSESPQDWDKALPTYFKNPAQKQTERYFQILDIGTEHSKSFREASILFDSMVEKVEETEGDN